MEDQLDLMPVLEGLCPVCLGRLEICRVCLPHDEWGVCEACDPHCADRCIPIAIHHLASDGQIIRMNWSGVRETQPIPSRMSPG